MWRNQHQRVGYNRNWEVKNNETSVVEQGDQSHTVQTGKRTTTIQKDETLLVKQGDISVTAQAGSILIEACKQIQLKVGSNTITLTQGGITISGKPKVTVVADTVDVGGGGEVDVHAGIVKLN